jgi:hypothetical protein
MYKIDNSNIHGKGIFTTKDVKKDEIVGIIIENINKSLTITKDFGVYINHSEEPNTKLFIKEDKLVLKAIKNYNDSENPWYINKI